MQLFYCPDIAGDQHTLNEEESKHIVRVLRLKNGNFIHLTDGKGGLFTAKLIDDHPKRCTVQITERQTEFEKRNFRLQMAVAPTKNIARFEWFLEKATEIGVDEITPLFCEHSERKEVKNNRLEKVIVSAVKQSLKAYVPELKTGIKFKDFVKQDFPGQKFIAYCEGEPKHIKELYKAKSNVVILIGPEGDFSPEEVKLAQENSFEIISLGNSRLRTETAAIIACHAVNMVNE